MKSNIEPTPNRVFRRIFPGLKAVSMIQVMGWFPVIENLITVLNRRQGRRKSI
jgi:hypothetical protein